MNVDAWLAEFLRTSGFLERYPYYASVLARVRPVADPSTHRMAVSLHEGQFYLHVNAESFAKEPHFIKGVLLHEVHHIVLGHLTHPKFAECREPELMDLAIEMSANEHIEEPLPPAITIASYARAGIRKGQSTIERYEILEAHQRTHGARPRPEPGTEGRTNVDDHRHHKGGTTKPGALVQNAMLLERAIEDAERKRTPEPKNKGRKGRAEEGEKRRTEDIGTKLLAGRDPGRILEELTDTLRAPEIPLDWRHALSMFVARARSPVHTWARPNRRFPSRIFEVPGRSWAQRRGDKPKLLVAVDTSLSMTRKELEEIARHLVLLAAQAEIVVAECDTQVTRVYPFAGRLDTVMGRGGTDLRPALAADFLGTHDADGVVYFTDGDGPHPDAAPRVPVLFVLTKDAPFSCPFGERASLRRTST